MGSRFNVPVNFQVFQWLFLNGLRQLLIKKYETLYVSMVGVNRTSSISGQFAKAFSLFTDTVSLPTNSVVLKTVTMLLMTRHKELQFSSQNSSLAKDWSWAGHLTVCRQDRLEFCLG